MSKRSASKSSGAPSKRVSSSQVTLFRVLVQAFREKVRTYQEWHAGKMGERADELEGAHRLAAQRFDGLVEVWIARGNLDKTLQDMTAANVEPQSLLTALHDHVHQRIETRLVQGETGWEEWTLIGWPIVTTSLDPAPEVWEIMGGVSSMTEAAISAMHLDAQDVTWRPLSRPIHPLAWGRLSLDQRIAVYDEMVAGQPGSAVDHLLARDADVREQAGQVSGEPIRSLVRLWPIWVCWSRGDVAPGEAPSPLWEHRLRQSLPQPAWQQMRMEILERTGGQIRAEASLAMEDALAYSALMHVRSRQALDDRNQGYDAQAQRSIELTQMAQKGRALRLSFARMGQVLPSRTLPWQWLGTSYRGREQTIAQLSLGWPGKTSRCQN